MERVKLMKLFVQQLAVVAEAQAVEEEAEEAEVVAEGAGEAEEEDVMTMTMTMMRTAAAVAVPQAEVEQWPVDPLQRQDEARQRALEAEVPVAEELLVGIYRPLPGKGDLLPMVPHTSMN